ncbi:MAG: GFA family protein [Hyphomicrobiaceae bacterium]
MQTYHGSCHCGDITYEIDADLSRLTRCTCSMCTKKGALLVRVKPENLRVTGGQSLVRLYQFNKMIAKHFFCPTCGVHPFGHPRTAPELSIVNVNTLDDFDIHSDPYEITIFDGRDWERAFAESQTANSDNRSGDER